MSCMPAAAVGSALAIGIDVGGARKGFHAVALQGMQVSACFASADAAAVAAWCRSQGATAVGVDAPCRWSTTGRARAAERMLMRRGIACFASPTRATAADHPRNYYGWMLCGEALFAELEKSHRLYDGSPGAAGMPACFETFPQAVACIVNGAPVSARDKRMVRRQLLQAAGIDTAALTHIDWIDAALCALTARAWLLGRTEACGDEAEGYILLPAAGAIALDARHP